MNSGGYPSVVYSGSLERIDFGEEKEQKGFCWVKLARGETEWNFVPVDARSFLTIRVDARDFDDPTALVVSTIKKRDIGGKVVRIVLQLKSRQSASLRDSEITSALASAYSHSVVREVDNEARTRIRGISAETLTHFELLEHYFEDKGYDQDRIKLLLSVARSIFDGAEN